MARKKRADGAGHRHSSRRQRATSEQPSGVSQHRRLLAEEAARILAEEGLRDYQMAKRKAAQHLGLSDTSQWPANDEIEQAVTERLALFGGTAHQQSRRIQLDIAVDAMLLFQAFNPRLVGPLLRGSATAHTPIELHLFADTREDVTIHLMDSGIDYDLCDKQVRTGHKHQGTDQHERIMGVQLEVDGVGAGSVDVVALIFPVDSIRQAPRSPIDGKGMARADINQVRALLSVETYGSETAT